MPARSDVRRAVTLILRPPRVQTGVDLTFYTPECANIGVLLALQGFLGCSPHGTGQQPLYRPRSMKPHCARHLPFWSRIPRSWASVGSDDQRCATDVVSAGAKGCL